MRKSLKAVIAAGATFAFALSCGTVAFADEGIMPIDDSATDPAATDPADTTGPTTPAVLTFGDSDVSLAKDFYIYTGKKITPKVTVATANGTLVEGTDYTVSYSKNKAEGTAKATVTGMGSYEGSSATATFTIARAQVTYSANGGDDVKEKKTAGATSGTTSISKIAASLSSSTLDGGIQYRIMGSDNKWSDWQSDGDTASAKSGTGTNVIEFKLTGEVAKYYKVCYRVNVNYYGWMQWGINGKAAGIKKIEDITARGYQLKLVAKDKKSPKHNVRFAVKYGGGKYNKIVNAVYESKVEDMTSSTGYAIVLSTDYNRVGVYKKSGGEWELYKMMACGTGKPGSPTIKGTFHIGEKGYCFDTKGNDGTCWYYSQISGNYLFHSWITKLHNINIKKYAHQTSRNISHGCVRLTLSNAKWLQQTIPCGTTVKIFGSV